MGTSTVPIVLDRLKTLLESRTGLTQVEVTTAGMADNTKPESIQLGIRVTSTQEFATTGADHGRHEYYIIHGAIQIKKAGAGETVAKEARDRAYAIYKEVEDTVREDPSIGLTSVLKAQVNSADLDQYAGDRARNAVLDFQIDVHAYI